MTPDDGRAGHSATGSPRSFRSRLSRAALFAAGLILLVVVFHAVGWSAIEANLAAVGGWFFFLAAIYALPQAAFTQGWRAVLDAPAGAVPFRSLYAIYLAGDAVNAVAPANIAGEPFKARMLRERIGLEAAVASLSIHKHADLFAQWIFLCVGLGLALARFSLPLAVRIAAVGGAAAMGVALLFMTWALRKGSYSPILRALGRLRFLAARLERLAPAAELLDERIRAFYQRPGRRFLLATMWCLLGWCGGLVETRIVLAILAPHRGWMTAIAVETLAMALNNMLIFVPGRIGTAEGVRVGVFLLVGLPAATGGAYALIRRAREIVWMLPGFVVLLRRHALLPTRADRAAPRALPVAPGRGSLR